MNREMTNSEAISNLNHIYGIVSPDIQRSLDVAIKALEEKPKGYWDKVNHGDYENLDIAIRCSECLEEVDEESNYCPNCGADMRGDQDDG